MREALKGAIASACGRASRPRSRPSAAPFLAIQAYARVVDMLLFESQAERSRPWFAQVHASGRGLAFSLQSYAELFSLHWVPPDGAVLAPLGEWHPAGTV